MKTLKERLIDLRQKYEGYTTEIEIKGSYQYLDKYKRTGKWRSEIQTNLDQSGNKAFAAFINANKTYVLKQIKAKALESYKGAKTAYNQAKTAYDDAIANNTEIPEANEKAMLRLRDIQNDLQPLKDVTEVEVNADDNFSIKIVNGFNSLNRLFVEVLNDNKELIASKFPEFIQGQYEKELQELIDEAQEFKDELAKG